MNGEECIELNVAKLQRFTFAFFCLFDLIIRVFKCGTIWMLPLVFIDNIYFLLLIRHYTLTLKALPIVIIGWHCHLLPFIYQELYTHSESSSIVIDTWIQCSQIPRGLIPLCPMCQKMQEKLHKFRTISCWLVAFQSIYFLFYSIMFEGNIYL